MMCDFFNTKFAEVTQRSRRGFEIRHQTNRQETSDNTGYIPQENISSGAFRFCIFLYASSSHFVTISNDTLIIGNLRENSLKAECLFQI